jgi:hypothetical protein
MLVEERLHLRLVRIAKGGRGDGDLVAVLVVPRSSKIIDISYIWIAEI